MVTKSAVADVEARLRGEYTSCFPGAEGWEAAALLLLLAHHLMVPQRVRFDEGFFDTSKYALMHALRWGRDCRSIPLTAPPGSVDLEALSSAVNALRQAECYDDVRGAFLMNFKGVLGVKSLSASRIEFTPNLDWLAFDVLDRKIHSGIERSTGTSQFRRSLGRVVTNALAKARPYVVGPEAYETNQGQMRALVRTIQGIHEHFYTLSRGWCFDDIPIGALRSVWEALNALASVHHVVTDRLHKEDPVTFANLIVWPRSVWVERVSALTALDSGTVSRVLDLHTYDRCGKDPDISLTPLVSVGPELLAAGTSVLNTSSFERNFCAHAARKYWKLYGDSEKGISASKMTADLVIAFERAGFRAGGRVKIGTTTGKGDIDLLVWSELEQFVLAAELVCFIDPGDFIEVVNRCEHSAIEKLTVQLPKYEAALEAGAGSLVAKALRLRKAPQVKGHASILIMRGFCGTPRMRKCSYSFVDERLLLTQLGAMPRLRELSDWCAGMSYLPRVGIDFRVTERTVRSPSGYRVVTHGAELPNRKSQVARHVKRT